MKNPFGTKANISDASGNSSLLFNQRAKVWGEFFGNQDPPISVEFSFPEPEGHSLLQLQIDTLVRRLPCYRLENISTESSCFAVTHRRLKQP